MLTRKDPIALVAAFACTLATSVLAAGSLALIDFSAADSDGRLKPGSEQVTHKQTPEGLLVRIEAGPAGYPGIRILPEGDAWDLSAYGHVEARITNVGDSPLSLSLRVDNAGDWKQNPWNCESKYIKPGKSETVKVIFGYQYGMKRGFTLDPAEVVGLLFFTGKAKTDMAFRIESVVAAGPAGEKPPVDPKSVRIRPTQGYLFGGANLKLDAEKQVVAEEGADIALHSVGGQQALQLTYDGDATSHRVSLRPPMGRWNLGHTTEVRAKLTNTGTTPITPSVQVLSGTREGTQVIATDAPLQPGDSCELIVPYAAEKPWEGPHHDIVKAHTKDKVAGTGTDFSSHKVSEIKLTATHDGAAAMRLDSIRAVVTPAMPPAWVGTRPPVDGDWVVTFDEPFDGDSVNLDKWNVHGPNWWGVHKLTHWSRDNVIVSDGTAKIHFEKKTGFHNDDPEGKPSPYAGGYLSTYGKWTQKYGYFESRMKLPVATGIWPAFWMMPDRGVEAGEQWRRANTGDGGMEFDIMEHLTSWGPYRYTIAMHWDGYKDGHKATGARVYFQPDDEGYVTSGLLWTPGLAVFYCQGKEVARWENHRISSIPSNMIFTLPVGGWENAKHPVDEELPVDFEIDYVRVWQRKDLLETTP